jgi:hypothetical protein
MGNAQSLNSSSAQQPPPEERSTPKRGSPAMPILDIRREYAIHRLVRLLRQAAPAAYCEGLLSEVERCFGRPRSVSQHNWFGEGS